MTNRPAAFDLQTYRENTWDIRVSETEVLHVRKPSERVLIRMMDAQAEVERMRENPREILPLITEFLSLALSNNREGIEIGQDWFDAHDIDLMTKVDIFKAYGEYVQGVMADPNSASPRSQS